jgi:hypothetical protein
MRPRGLSLISKGILAIKKSISVATRSMLDELLLGGGQAQIKTEEWTFNVIGEKVFWQLYNYSLTGKRTTSQKLELNLFGKRLAHFESAYNIQAFLQSILNYESLIWGRRQFLFINDFALHGTKECENIQEIDILATREQILTDKMLVCGAKQFNIEDSILFTGTRQYNTLKLIDIEGTKEINSHNNLLIKGKRDIKPILVALDLIGGE